MWRTTLVLSVDQDTQHHDRSDEGRREDEEGKEARESVPPPPPSRRQRQEGEEQEGQKQEQPGQERERQVRERQEQKRQEQERQERERQEQKRQDQERQVRECQERERQVQQRRIREMEQTMVAAEVPHDPLRSLFQTREEQFLLASNDESSDDDGDGRRKRCVICLRSSGEPRSFCACTCDSALYHPECLDRWIGTSFWRGKMNFHCTYCKEMYKRDFLKADQGEKYLANVLATLYDVVRVAMLGLFGVFLFFLIGGFWWTMLFLVNSLAFSDRALTGVGYSPDKVAHQYLSIDLIVLFVVNKLSVPEGFLYFLSQGGLEALQLCFPSFDVLSWLLPAEGTAILLFPRLRSALLGLRICDVLGYGDFYFRQGYSHAALISTLERQNNSWYVALLCLLLSYVAKGSWATFFTTILYPLAYTTLFVFAHNDGRPSREDLAFPGIVLLTSFGFVRYLWRLLSVAANLLMAYGPAILGFFVSFSCAGMHRAYLVFVLEALLFRGVLGVYCALISGIAFVFCENKANIAQVSIACTLVVYASTWALHFGVCPSLFGLLSYCTVPKAFILLSVAFAQKRPLLVMVASYWTPST